MRRFAAGAARVLLALALAGLLLGLPLLLLEAPPVTAVLVGRLYDHSAGIPAAAALKAAEQVRAYTTDPAAPALPATVAGRAGFDEAAASHLRDVRGVLLAARTATLALAALLACVLAFAIPRGSTRTIAGVLRGGASAALALALAAGVAGAVDFDRFFGAFHGLFFSAGTWEFPEGTLLIQLFPVPLWETLGALWAAGVLTGALIAFVAAWWVSRRRRSVVGQDV
jgi:hypothetical protein